MWMGTDDHRGLLSDGRLVDMPIRFCGRFRKLKLARQI
jgi:hypothetical protein